MMFSLASVHWTGVSGGRRRRGPSDSPGSSRWCDAQWHLGPQPIQDSIDISSRKIQQLTIYRSFSPCNCLVASIGIILQGPKSPKSAGKPRISRAMEGIPWLLLYILMISPRYTNSFDGFSHVCPIKSNQPPFFMVESPFWPFSRCWMQLAPWSTWAITGRMLRCCVAGLEAKSWWRFHGWSFVFGG
jgi:hypothetical protein